MEWFDDLAGYLLGKGYESALTHGPNEMQFVIFGPKPLDAEAAERVKWTKPSDVGLRVVVGLLHSTVMTIEKSFQGRAEIRDNKGSITVTIDPQLAEGVEEYRLLDVVDQAMSHDSYPWRYEVRLGDKSWMRYPRLASDFADHSHRVDISDLRIALETSKSLEEFLAAV